MLRTVPMHVVKVIKMLFLKVFLTYMSIVFVAFCITAPFDFFNIYLATLISGFFISGVVLSKKIELFLGNRKRGQVFDL